MSDEELIAWLRDLAVVLGKEAFTCAADRIELLATTCEQLVATNEALVKERDQWIEHTKNAVWSDSEELKLANARAERLEAVLRELIDHTHDCEKELTERLYRADFCGESLPLTNARAALKGN